MPEEPIAPVGKLRPVSAGNSNVKPVGQLKPVGVAQTPRITDFSQSPTDESNQLENTLNDIVKTSKRSISDDEKDILRDMLKNPSLTPEQARESIQAMQGYHVKQKDNTITTPDYYVKIDDNGVTRPIPLGLGERPPKGYQVANVWGQTKKNAQDDSWYTDMSKSLFNALPQLAKGMAEVGQLGALAITGEESELLNRTINTAESLKMFKDDNGGRTLYNPEGIEKFGDLISKKRFDFSPESLWNTVNWATESLPEFLLGAAEVGAGIKLATGAQKLGKAGRAASVFGGSYIVQAGENMEVAKEAGLKGREIAEFAMPVTFIQASIDAFSGLDIGAKLFNSPYRKTQNELVKKFAQAAKTDATGKISEQELKKIAKEFAVDYGRLAAIGAKQVSKDISGEMLQEAMQTATQLAGEQIWDKLTDEQKAKFGTDALSPRSFGEYIASGVNSLGVAPVSLVTADHKRKYDEQSLNAFEVVEGGQNKINEFKANVYHLARKGELTEAERDHAIFKVDSYNKYREQIKDLKNMSKEDKQEAFKLSFNIEALNRETDISKEDQAKLDPIAIGKIENKKELAKGLQKELNHLLLKQDIQTETKVGQDTINKVAKDEGLKKETKEGEENKEFSLNELLDHMGPIISKKADKIDTDEESVSAPPKSTYKRYAYDRENTPHFDAKDEKGQYEFNKLTDPISKQRAIRNYFDEHPELNNEMDVIIEGGQNNVWTFNLGKNRGRDDRYVQAARSIDPDKYTADVTNFPSNEKRRNIGDKDGRPYWVYDEPAVMRLESIETKEGGRKRFLNVYNKQTGKYIVSVKEKQKGDSTPSDEEIKLMEEIQKRGYTPPSQKKPASAPTQRQQPASQSNSEPISDQDYAEFIDNNNVNDTIITDIAIKVQNRAPLSVRETAIFSGKTAEVNRAIKEMADYSQNRPLEEVEVQEQLQAEQAREEAFAETGQFQKYASRSAKNIDKVIDRIKKSMPKMKVVYDKTLKSAGKVKGDTITINPDYAGSDTPLHEAGHVLIDAIGYGNKVIQAAIKQLKDTDFWKEIASRYPELSEELLGKEVLAEAIGREGAGIFDTEVKRSRFKQILDYIFARLKQLLGIDKNMAKSLAKQIIGGIGTKDLVGSQTEQLQKGNYDERLAGLLKEISEIENMSSIPFEDLLKVYNAVMLSDNLTKRNFYQSDIMRRIAMNLKERGMKLADKPIDQEEMEKDISWIDKWFKVLSHFSDAFPEMRYFSKLWNNAYFAKMKEAKEEKHTHDKLAADVIKAERKKLGLPAQAGRTVRDFLQEGKYKYFGFLDKGGRLIKLNEASGLNQAQIKYLTYVRETLAKRKKLTENEDVYNMDMDLLKLDKGFSEAFQTEGIISAVGSWIGAPQLSDVQINFTNPNTGKSESVQFAEVLNELNKYANKGLSEKAKALQLLFKYTIKAKKGKKTGSGVYSLDDQGNLRSKFDAPRNASRSYSKDFYSAMNQYIDDSAHIKHISPLVPVINSIEYLNKNGLTNGDEHQKKNVAEWIEQWTKLHILQKPDETQPELDKTLRMLRFMTSAVTMWFNVPANILNAAIGAYNSIRQESLATWLKGQARLFGGKKRKYGVLNKYAADIVSKYMVVAHDTDSSPILTSKNFFSKLGFLGQNWGEYQIQASGMLGLMSDKDYNSFEYKENDFGVEELVVKDGVDEKALEERILANIDKVSDVQGKYGDKDKRNVMNNEIGKMAMQFKVWMPDAWRVRYGSEGSWRKMLRGGFAELRNDISEKGTVKAFWENKDFMRNLKGLMATGLLVSLVYQNDDDDEKSFTARLFQKALSDVLFVFEPDNLKFTITRPIAAVGTVEKLIDLGDHLFAIEADDFYKKDSKYGNKGDSKLAGDVMGLLPGKKAIEVVDEIIED